jgi:hypothetical protein
VSGNLDSGEALFHYRLWSHEKRKEWRWGIYAFYFLQMFTNSVEEI